MICLISFNMSLFRKLFCTATFLVCFLQFQLCPADGDQVNFGSLMEAGDAAHKKFDNETALAAYRQAYRLDSTSYEVLWKLARTHVNVGQALKDPVQRQHYFLGERFARDCVRLYPDSTDGHFFLAVALGRVALKVGGKQKVRLAGEIEKEALRTLELDPRNDGAMHVLGRWNYELGDLSWILKAFAKVLYGGLPKAGGFEEARNWFDKAIAIDPNSPVHRLWMGKTLVKLKRYDEARVHLRKCLTLPDLFWDDQRNKELARQTLSDIEDKS